MFLDDLIRSISNTLGISYELLQFPNILTQFFLPLIFFAGAVYLMIEKIFKSKAINAFLSFSLSFFTVILSSSLRTFLPLISIPIILFKEMKGLKGFWIGLFLALVYYALIMWIVSLIE